MLEHYPGDRWSQRIYAPALSRHRTNDEALVHPPGWAAVNFIWWWHNCVYKGCDKKNEDSIPDLVGYFLPIPEDFRKK